MTTFFGACDAAGNPTGATSSGTGSAETDWNNTQVFTCPGSGPQTVSELSAFIKVVGAYNFRLAIYDAAGTTLLAQGTAAVAASGAADNWQGHLTQANITPNPVTLTGGTNYILAITSNGDIESDHWITGASGVGRFVGTDFTAGFTNGSLGSPSAATLVPPIRVGLAATSSVSSSLGVFSGRGRPSIGPRMRRSLPQQFPVGVPPTLPGGVDSPFRIGRGVSMGKPQRRMFPQRFADTVTSANVTLALTGVSSPAAVGTLGVSRTKPITGISETSAVGTVKANLTKALSGLSTTTVVGTLGVTRAEALSGVSSVTARGTLTSSRTVPLTGVQALSAVGTVSLPGDVTVALTGVSATGVVGTLTATVESSDTLPISKFRYIIRGKAKLHKSSHREMAELLDRVFSTPDTASVPAPLVEQVAAIVKPFVSKNELNLGKLYKDMKATRELLAVWEAETARMRAEDEDDDETVLLMS